MSKSISFHEEISSIVCTLPHREDILDDEREARYFSKADYNTSRSSAKVVSRESERYGFSKALEDTFAEKSPEIQDKLNLWAAQGHSRRGLERWANRQHGEVRQQEQFQVIMSILEAQDEMLLKKDEIDWEKLRKISHRATKVSRHFARMLGKADSYALSNELKGEIDESVSVDPIEGCASSIAESELTDDISMPAIDELRDSTHSKGTRRRRFGFGRKNRDNTRVSRVA